MISVEIFRGLLSNGSLRKNEVYVRLVLITVGTYMLFIELTVNSSSEKNYSPKPGIEPPVAGMRDQQAVHLVIHHNIGCDSRFCAQYSVLARLTRTSVLSLYVAQYRFNYCSEDVKETLYL